MEKFSALDFKRDTKYWDAFYKNQLAMKKPSPFALFVYDKYLNGGGGVRHSLS